MTAEEFIVSEYKMLRASHSLLQADYDDLREALDKAQADLSFLKGLFEFKDSYAMAYVSTANGDVFDRLKKLCGCGDQEAGDE